MNAYGIIGFIFMDLAGMATQSTPFCYEGYCYNSDGQLKNVINLKEAQDYCYNNDSSSWLLELYRNDVSLILTVRYSVGPNSQILLNTIAIIANQWTSDVGAPLHASFNINEKQGQDYLFVNKSGGKLYFYGTNNNQYSAYGICRYQGNCTDGYCYSITPTITSWFWSHSNCHFNPSFGGNGRMLPFDGMTYSDVYNLSVIGLMANNINYWVGYSKIYYKNMHSNTRNYVTYFDMNYPKQSSSLPNESYYVFFPIYDLMRDKPVLNDSFVLICMKSNETASELTTTAASVPELTILLSLFLPTILWLVFSISLVCIILPLCVNRKARKSSKE